MRNDHKFISFVFFNKYEDIGFFHENINIEACVNFLFLSQRRNKLFLNLMLIDQYYKHTQFALFTSSYYADFDQFNRSDMI